MPTIEARRAQPGDLAAVSALRAAALDEVAALRGGPLYRSRHAVEIGPDTDLWVGLIDGAVVGYLAARIDQPLAVIDAVYVDAGCRSVGVGAAMLGLVRSWVVAAGCTGIDATALPGSRSTKNFFEEMGFTARLLVMHHSLGGPPPAPA